MSTTEIKFQKSPFTAEWVASYQDMNGNNHEDNLLGKRFSIKALVNHVFDFAEVPKVEYNQVHAVLLTDSTLYQPGSAGKYNMWLGKFEILTERGPNNSGLTSTDWGITAIGTADIADVGGGGTNLRTLQYGLVLPQDSEVFIYMPEDHPGLILIYSAIVASTHQMHIRSTNRTGLTWKR